MYNYTYDFNYDRVAIEIPGKDIPGLLDYVSELRFGQTVEEFDDIWDNFGFEITKDHISSLSSWLWENRVISV